MHPYHDQAEGLRRIMGLQPGRIMGLLQAGSQPQLAVPELLACLRATSPRCLHVQASANQATHMNPPISMHAYGHDHTWFVENERFTPALSANTSHSAGAIVEAWTHNYDLVLLDSLAPPAPALAQTALITQMWRYPMLVVMPASTEGLQLTYLAIKQASQRLGKRPLAVVVSGQPASRSIPLFKQLQQVTQRFMQLPLQLAGSLTHASDLQGLQLLAQQLHTLASPPARPGLANVSTMPTVQPLTQSDKPSRLMTA